MVRETSQDAILDAAQAVVLERGASHVTLEAVAERAGLSKGGVLYHFQNKEAMLAALVERMVRTFTAVVEEKRRLLGGDPSRALEAHVEAVFSMGDQMNDAACALLPALASNPVLLEPLRALYREHHRELAASRVGQDQAAIVSLALDGLWLMDMFQISPLAPADEARIKALLLRMASEPLCPGAPGVPLVARSAVPQP
jgi:AcrR family transcriptional regulator